MTTASIAQILDRLDPEVWIVTAADGSRRGGLVATFVTRASIVPEMPRMLVGLSVCHFTRDLVEGSGAFALHLLDESQLDWVWRFGLRSGREADKFAGLTVVAGATGSPLLAEAAAVLECRVEDCFDTGDRSVYLAAVVDGRAHEELSPLRMSRLMALAPLEYRQQLKSQLTRDCTRDADLIETWRRQRGAAISRQA